MNPRRLGTGQSASGSVSSSRSTLRAFAMGGLGNQIFQLAALWALSRRWHLSPVIDVDWYRDYPQRDFWLDRVIDLDALGVGVKTTPRALNPSMLVSARWTLRRRMPLPTKFIEHGPRYDERIFEARNVRTIVGHFQSFRYFSDDLDWFLAHLHVGLEAFALQGASQGSRKATVALHLRFGDYLTPDNLAIYGPTPVAYVARALGLVRAWEDRLPDVVVFTDEHDRAADTIDRSLGTLGNFTLSNEASPPVDLLRMSESKYLVMANSSMSWWAAALADARGGQVFFPRPWTFHPPYDGCDLARPGWHVLDR